MNIFNFGGDLDVIFRDIEGNTGKSEVSCSGLNI